MTGRLQVRLLGPFDVTVDGATAGPRGSLRRSVLALLALRAGEAVSVDALVDGLWGDKPPQTATGVLQTYVSTWRKAFESAGTGPRIATVGAGYRLDLADSESDLLAVTALTADAQRLADEGRPREARQRLEQALALWRGPVLADLSDRPFHASATRPLEEQRRRTLEDWAELVLRTGSEDDSPAVASALERLLAESPWRERAAVLLMWTLFRQSRQRDALDLFDRTRRRLGEELGIDPGPALRAMHARVLRQDPGLLADPVRRARRAPRLDSFVGRDDDVHRVHDLLGRARLVTLTGPGGAGKTRLAEEVAADVAARSGGDAVVVELAAVEDVDLVPAAIAARLGGQPAGTLDALVARLADRDLLLVLDNLEQIPDAGALVTALLSGAPSIRVLATSRQPLHAAGEHRHVVEPLPLPAPAESDPARLRAVPSVALLLDRAGAEGLRGDVDGEAAAALRDVVRAVDGLPLALEIVAPWLATLGAPGVLAELRDPLDLRGRRSDAAGRHRTVRSAIAWSYERLDADQQRLLARLSVLRGSGDLDAVRAVAGPDPGSPVAETLLDLVERNLVRPAEPVAGAPRFRLLETVRRFAAERLAAAGETGATELRAAEHFGRWAAGLARNSGGPDADRWLARAVADADNLRAAMDALERAGRAEAHLQLVTDVVALWSSAGLEGEGERRLARALRAAPAAAAAAPVALTFLAWFVAVHDLHVAGRLLDEAVDRARRAGDEEGLAVALTFVGDIAPDPAAARAANEEIFALAQRLRGRPHRYAQSHPDFLGQEAAGNLAGLAQYRSLATALAWQRRSVEFAERLGDRRNLAWQHAQLSFLHVLAGDVASAERSVQRARALAGEELTGRWGDNVRMATAVVQAVGGRPDLAEQTSRQIITAGLSDERLLHVHYASCFLADLLLARGEVDEADAVLRRAEDLLPDSPDLRHVTRVRVRRARLLRLTGYREAALGVLKEAEKGLQPDCLTLEHVIWLVERALLATADGDADAAHAWAHRLETLSRRSGVRPLPWECRLLDGVAGP